MAPNTYSRSEANHSDAFSQLVKEHALYASALTKTKEKEYALTILEAELLYRRLLCGLEESGMVLQNFRTQLHPILLAMMGFTHAEIDDMSLASFYHEQIQHHMQVPIEKFEECVTNIAMETFLCLQKRLEHGLGEK